MELLLSIIGIVFIAIIFEELTIKFKSIIWSRFLFFLVVGAGLLAVLFSYTSENVIVIVGASIVLIVLALFFSVFSRKSSEDSHNNDSELTPQEIATNLLDVLDDEIIAEKTKLSVSEVKELRSKNNLS
ncbi:hypothetical protein NBRC116583_39220 [Arenicella sp. 4NH20-0111]|uniref:hypothetical protein n=1 Tax=Arenicella sp. 4NH20-0111 TaxID=3127648 RepID=UPI003102C758